MFLSNKDRCLVRSILLAKCSVVYHDGSESLGTSKQGGLSWAWQGMR